MIIGFPSFHWTADKYNNCTKYKTTANRYIGIYNLQDIWHQLVYYHVHSTQYTYYNSLRMFWFIIHIHGGGYWGTTPPPSPFKKCKSCVLGDLASRRNSRSRSRSRLLYYTGVLWKVGVRVDYCIILE